MSQESIKSVSRRDFLKNSAIAAAVLGSGISFGTAFGIRTSRAQEDDATTILNIAATAETFAVTHYYRALQGEAKFTEAQIAYIKAGLEAEYQHLEFLNNNGAKALASEFYFPEGTFKDAKSFGTVTSIAETVFVAAYIAATQSFAKMGNPALAATAAQIAVVEGQHLALVRQMSEQLANNLAYGKALFKMVSEAVPVVAPLLDGKEGGLGKMETKAVAYPGADAVRMAIGESLLDKEAIPVVLMK